MRIFITGHRGLLGSACVRFYENTGHEVVTTNLRLDSLANARYAMAELRPEAVIHCAAKVGGIAANKADPIGFLHENLKIQNAVFAAAFEHGVQNLIFVGTSCMYPKTAPVPVSEQWVMHGPLEPDVEAYAIAKIAGWRLVKAYKEKHGLNWTTVAPCNLYAEHNDSYGLDRAHVIPALINKLYRSKATGEPFVVWGSGNQLREFLHADDAASAIHAVLASKTPHDLVNIGPGQGTTIAELVATLFSVAGTPPVVEWMHDAPIGIEKKTFCTKRLKSITDWEPKISIEDGLKKTWQAYVASQNA